MQDWQSTVIETKVEPGIVKKFEEEIDNIKPAAESDNVETLKKNLEVKNPLAKCCDLYKWYYLTDLNQDGNVELLEVLDGSEGSCSLATVYTVDTETMLVKNAGVVMLEGGIAVGTKFYLMEDALTQEHFLYNVVDEYFPQTDRTLIIENRYYLHNENYEREQLSAYEMGETDGVEEIAAYKERCVSAMTTSYNLLDEVLVEDCISRKKIQTGLYQQIIEQYGICEPEVTIIQNGKLQQYPWNTYQYVVEGETDWEELKKLPNLKSIKFETAEAVCMEGMEALDNVIFLNVNNTNLTQENQQVISRMTNLEYLSIKNDESLDWSLFQKLENLRWLSVVGKISDEFRYEMKELDKLPKLEMVELYNCSEEMGRMFQKNLPHCQVLSALFVPESALAVLFAFDL